MKSRLPLVVVVSVGLHLLAAFALMSLPGRELVRKIIPITMVERKKVKAPEPKKEPPKRTQLAKHAPPRPKALPKLQPRPAQNPQSPNSPTSFGVAEGPDGTMEVPVGDSLEAEATASAPRPLVLDFSDDSGKEPLAREPEPIGRLRVNYPEVARIAGATGSATVLAWVEADGRVTRAEVQTYLGGIAFARAAEEAVRQTRFKPALREGVAVACSIKVPIEFSLSEVQSGKEE